MKLATTTVAVGPSVPSGFRSRWSPRTRPGRSRSRPPATARTATASRACSSSRATTVDREYYYNDAGGQMDRFRASVEALRRGEEPPEDGYHGEYVAELAAVEGDPVPAMLERIEATMERFRIHFDSWTKQSDLEHELPALLAELPTYEAEGATLRALDRLRRREGPGARPVGREREACRPTRRPTSRTSGTSSSAATTARSTCSAPTITASPAGSRSIARMLGYDPARVEVLLYQLVHLTRGGEQTKMSKRRGDVVFLDDFIDEVGVDAARWYLVDRGPDHTIEIDVDLAAEKSRARTRSTTCRWRTRASRVSSATPATGAVGGRPAVGPARAAGARAREAARRVPGDRAGGGRAPRARSSCRPTRSSSPTTSTASTTTTASSASRRRGVPARPLPRDPARDRPRASTSSGSRRPSGCRRHGRGRRFGLDVRPEGAWRFPATVPGGLDCAAPARCGSECSPGAATAPA